MKKVVKAVFVLSFFTIIERIAGFLFKVYLGRKMGAASVGVYQVAFSFLIVLLTLTSSGIPLIVSKLTAKYRSEKNLAAESSLSSAALILSTIISAVICLAVLALNRLIGRLFADDNSRVLLLLMLPAVLFSAVYSSLRGNLWGREKYATVSLLELSEQTARIGLCLLLFAIGINKLNAVAISLTIGCLFSALACVICYFAWGSKLKNPKGQFKPLIKSSAPVTASRAATSLVGSLTAITVPFLLTQSGMTKTQAMYAYGYSFGMALPLMYIPLTIVGSLAFVMIPALSQAVAQNNKAAAKRNIEGSIKMACVAGAVFFPLFYALGEPVGTFIYKNADAGVFLRQASWLLLPISIESITSSMMNSLDMEIKGFTNYLIGSMAMFAAFFLSGKYFNMSVVNVAFGVALLIASAFNISAMRKKAGIGFSFIAPLAVSVMICLPSTFLCKWLFNITFGLPSWLRIILSGGTAFCFIVALNFVFGTLKIRYFISKKTAAAA